MPEFLASFISWDASAFRSDRPQIALLMAEWGCGIARVQGGYLIHRV